MPSFSTGALRISSQIPRGKVYEILLVFVLEISSRIFSLIPPRIPPEIFCTLIHISSFHSIYVFSKVAQGNFLRKILQYSFRNFHSLVLCLNIILKIIPGFPLIILPIIRPLISPVEIIPTRVLPRKSVKVSKNLFRIFFFREPKKSLRGRAWCSD